MLFKCVFDAEVSNCHGEQVQNPTESDAHALSSSAVETNLVCYVHCQDNFTSLKQGFRYMDLYENFKGSFIYFVISIILLHPISL